MRMSSKGILIAWIDGLQRLIDCLSLNEVCNSTLEMGLKDNTIVDAHYKLKRI